MVLRVSAWLPQRRHHRSDMQPAICKWCDDGSPSLMLRPPDSRPPRLALRHSVAFAQGSHGSSFSCQLSSCNACLGLTDEALLVMCLVCRSGLGDEGARVGAAEAAGGQASAVSRAEGLVGVPASAVIMRSGVGALRRSCPGCRYRSAVSTSSQKSGVRFIAIASCEVSHDRKNWGLFVGSQQAGEGAAVIMRLIESAKLNGHDPWACIKDVLERLPTLKQRDIEQLLPHNWRTAAMPVPTARSAAELPA